MCTLSSQMKGGGSSLYPMAYAMHYHQMWATKCCRGLSSELAARQVVKEGCNGREAHQWCNQDWPKVTKYAGLVCGQSHRQELIQDLFKTSQDPKKGHS